MPEREPTVTINAHRWDRVVIAARLAVHYQLTSVKPGDLDEPEWDFHPGDLDPMSPNVAPDRQEGSN